jgi:ABC-2 type transport system permease protein
MKLRRLLGVMVKELRQMRRDRITLAMIIGIPVMQLLLFGYAINTNLRDLSAGFADQARTSASRMLARDIVATGVVAPVLEAETPQQLVEAMRRGQISIGIVIPMDYERRRSEGREALQILVDGSDNAVQSAAAQLARMPFDGAGFKPLAPTAISVVGFYNPQRSSAVNIVPGLVGVILTMTMVLFTAPVTSAELMIGKVIPYVIIGLLQTGMVLALGTWLFHVPIGGSLLDVFIAAGLLIVANLALGLLISTRAQSQFQAMQMTFFIFLPSILLSGFMFPFAGMPRSVQWLAEVLPLTHFLRLIRGVMLRGASLWELWPGVVALLAFSTVMMAGAILRFRKRLD